MGQAEIQTQIDHLTVDGLEEIFVESERVTPPSREDSEPPPLCLTFKQACEHFGLKATALRARIKSGEIRAEKVDGVNGPAWRVYPTQPLRDPNTPPAKPSRQGVESAKLLELVEDLQAKLDLANRQLQAASFRNGYLEAQVEGQLQQIKLLADSQSKTFWWKRFCSWFLGVRS